LTFVGLEELGKKQLPCGFSVAEFLQKGGLYEDRTGVPDNSVSEVRS